MYKTTTAPFYEPQLLQLQPFATGDAQPTASTLNDAEMYRGLSVVPFSHHLTDATVKSGPTDENHGLAEVLEKLGFGTNGGIMQPNRTLTPDTAGKAFVCIKGRREQHA